LARAEQRFGTVVQQDRVGFVFLKRRGAVEAARYPYITMLGQSLGSIWLGLEALRAARPDVFLDTMGYAFVLPLFRWLGGCPVGCYVHYPTISTDMLAKVAARRSDFNNTGRVSRSPLLSRAKLYYYRLFAKAYGLAGSCARVVMVNSSWTQAHIAHLWRGTGPRTPTVVFPPCDTAGLCALPLTGRRESIIVSVAQFRPEKNHRLQLQALAQLLQKHPEMKGKVSGRMRKRNEGGRESGDRALKQGWEEMRSLWWSLLLT
jgi:alpha-1,2-mannosyltransferase